MSENIFKIGLRINKQTDTFLRRLALEQRKAIGAVARDLLNQLATDSIAKVAKPK
jgi:hypothetical protein